MSITPDEYAHNQMNAESIWDAKAADYNNSQNRQGMKDSYKVAEWMHQNKRLTDDEVLDVGGGAGLYAIPFAHFAKNVTITDISSNMLSFAKINAASKGVHNLKYVKLNWDKANLKDLGWENHYGLVFSSMCPAIREGESIDKMIAASKNWCCVNRIIKMNDSIEERIANILHVSVGFDSRHKRDRIQSIFSYLWTKGYEPEIDYIEEITEKSFTVDEALIHYGGHYHSICENQHVNLKKIISEMAENHSIKSIRTKKLALLSWQV